jgi:hydroxyacylglutathione hydrolase
MTIAVTIVPVTAYQQNCSIIKCEATGKAAIVDPGGDSERILATVEKMGATVEKISTYPWTYGSLCGE